MVMPRVFWFLCCTAGSIGLAVLGSPHGEGQTVGESPRRTFEVVSIKRTPRDMMSYSMQGGPGSSDPARILYRSVDWGIMLRKAFGLAKDQYEPLGWMRTGEYLYDIEALLPPGTTEQQFRLMFLNMLTDRFHLVYHRGQKSFPGYELRVAPGGPKIYRSDTSGGADQAAALRKRWVAEGFPAVPLGKKSAMKYPPMLGPGGIIRGTFHESMDDFLMELPTFIKQSNRETGHDYPYYRLVDRTGLEGVYDFRLEFFGGSTLDIGGGPSIFEALERQLGLQLKRTKDVDVELIVIDSAEKLPAEN